MNDSTVESIIEYMCKQNSTKFLRFSDVYKPRNREAFSLNYKDLKCKIVEEVYTENGQLDRFTFEIYSEIIYLEELQEFVENIKKLYELEKKNQLGTDRYFFKEMSMAPMKIYNQATKREEVNWSQARKRLCFQMTKFKTNKSLNNIFGSQVIEIQKHVDLFMNHPEWYKKRGIPRTLGILLHGAPGTGKTSTIKAIAKDTNKHIFSISLSRYTTKEQLNNLFFNEQIEVLQDLQSVFYRIPLEQRLYVFEDIDCLTDVVLDRELKEKEKTKASENAIEIQQRYQERMQQQGGGIIMGWDSGTSGIGMSDFAQPKSGSINEEDSVENHGITLSYLLNLLDGILETDQRLLIMTSNYPEKLDRALIRPGRIDLNIKFSKMTPDTLEEMFHYFYELEGTNVYKFDDMFYNQFTPAEVIQILAQHHTNPDQAYHHLLRISSTSDDENEL
jgi:hypothetical protein